MKLIKNGSNQLNLERVLNNHRISWSAKGIYCYLIQIPEQTNLSLNELSTHSKDGIINFKKRLKELINQGYLIINNKLLIIRKLNSSAHELANHRVTTIIKAHDKLMTNRVLRNQWLIIWHHDDAQVTKALVKLANYLNVDMVLYGIQLSREHCRNYRESLPYLNHLIMGWKHHGLTTINQTQHWMHKRKLNSKPWNSETQARIFSSPRRQIINNSPFRKKIPDVFKKKSGKNKKRK